jgi:FtsH-binding integral membrane protein
MSYGYEYEMPAALAAADSRATFIRRTYGHLAGAILAFIALTAFLLQLPGIDQFVLNMMFRSQYSWLLVLGAFMAVSWIADRWAQSETSRAMQYVGLGLYVVAWSVLCLPLLWMANTLYPGENIIPTAGILTLAVFGGLTAGAFITRKDFSYLGPILCVGSFIAFGFILASTLLGFSLGLVFCFAMVALASGYILYQTSQILHHYRTDQYVAASLALFSSVALLFWYILQIMMRSRD